MESKINTYEIPLDEYDGLVRKCCLNWRNWLKTILLKEESLHLGEADAIIVVGSDGKEERHPQSKTEIVLLRKGLEKNKRENSSLQIPNSLPSQILYDEIRLEEVPPPILSYYNNSPKAVYPDLILNSILILGNPKTHLQARIKVIKEMTDDGPIGKRIREELKKQLSSYRTTLSTGFYRGLPVFADGWQYYYENEDPKKLQLGFKMGPLRVVQRRLDILTVEAWKKNLLNDQEIPNLPTNTCDRIDYFCAKGLIKKDFASQLQQAYLWFLREYHRVQEIFKNSDRKKIVGRPYDQTDFEKHKSIVIRFSSLEFSKSFS